MEALVWFVILLSIILYIYFYGKKSDRTRFTDDSKVETYSDKTYYHISEEEAYLLRTYLEVPFAEKDSAKEEGAKWDAKRKQWYFLAEENVNSFERWLPKLSVELIPNITAGINLRNKMTKEDWSRLRRTVISQSHNKCEVCFKENSSLHCHEVWFYDYLTITQSLERFQALCDLCHSVKHIGHTMNSKDIDYNLSSLGHLARVNQWNMSQVFYHIQDHFRVNRYRNDYNWKVDLKEKHFKSY